MRLLALSLGLPADFFKQHFTKPLASLRPLHYTAAVSAPEEVRLSHSACFCQGCWPVCCKEPNDCFACSSSDLGSMLCITIIIIIIIACSA